MFKKSLAAIALSFIMMLSLGNGAFASEIKVVDEVPTYSFEEDMSAEVIAAIEDVNKVNEKIEAEILKNQEKAKEMHEQYLKQLEKETDINEQEILTAKYEKQITKLIVDLQVKAEEMTEKGMAKATEAGIVVEMVYVNGYFGDRFAAIDPIVVVSW